MRTLAVFQGIDVNRYECHVCGQRYTRGSGLTNHLKKKHSFSWPAGHPRFRLVHWKLFKVPNFILENIEYRFHHDDKIGQSTGWELFYGFVYQFKSSNHLVQHSNQYHMGHCRNMRGLGKSMLFPFFFEKLRCSNERSTKE